MHLAAMSYLLAKQREKSRNMPTAASRQLPKISVCMRFWQRLIGPCKVGRVKSLQMGVDADGPPTLWWKLGILQIAQGKFDEAKVTAKGLRSKAFPTLRSEFSVMQVAPSVYADLLEAQLSQVQGHWQDATKQIGQIGVGLKADPALARSAFYSQGKTYEQLADFERALRPTARQLMPTRCGCPLARPSPQPSSRWAGAVKHWSAPESGRIQDASLATRVALIRESIAEISQLSADNAIGAMWTSC